MKWIIILLIAVVLSVLFVLKIRTGKTSFVDYFGKNYKPSKHAMELKEKVKALSSASKKELLDHYLEMSDFPGEDKNEFDNIDLDNLEIKFQYEPSGNRRAIYTIKMTFLNVHFVPLNVSFNRSIFAEFSGSGRIGASTTSYKEPNTALDNEIEKNVPEYHLMDEQIKEFEKVLDGRIKVPKGYTVYETKEGWVVRDEFVQWNQLKFILKKSGELTERRPMNVSPAPMPRFDDNEKPFYMTYDDPYDFRYFEKERELTEDGKKRTQDNPNVIYLD